MAGSTDTSSTDITGLVEPGFEAVRDAFARNFQEGSELGAAFCVHVGRPQGGRPLRRLVRQRTAPRPYGPDALQLVFSTTKGATAVCANLLAQRGLLDLDAPVATYWPEFAQAGKESMPVRYLLCHQAGVPADRPTADPRRAPVLDAGHRGARRAGAVLDAGDRARVSRPLVRLPGGRGGPADHRPLARDLLRRGGGRPARTRVLHRAARGVRAARLAHRRGQLRRRRLRHRRRTMAAEAGRRRATPPPWSPGRSIWAVPSGTGTG